jgi:hypothetical protein
MTPSESIIQYTTTSPYFALFGVSDPKQRDLFLEQFGKLPPSIQDFLLSPEVAQGIAQVSTQFGLSLDQAEVVARIMREVTVGNLFIGDAPGVFSQKLNCSPQVGTDLTRALVQSVLLPIANDIKKLRGETPSQPTSPDQPASPQAEASDNTLNLRQKGE